MPTCDSSPASSARWIWSADAGCRLRRRPRSLATSRSWRTRSCHSRTRTWLRNSARHMRRKALDDRERCSVSRWCHTASTDRKSESGSAKRACISFASASWSVGPLPDVLDRQGGGEDHHLAHAVLGAGLEDHAAEAGVDRQPGEAPAHVGQRPVGAHRPQLDQQGDGVAHGVGVGRVDERERLDVAQPQRRHLQDDRRQVGAEDLGLGELGPGLEVLLVVEADADARRHPAAAARPLVRRRLADGLDGQALDLRAAVVAGDAGGARGRPRSARPAR